MDICNDDKEQAASELARMGRNERRTALILARRGSKPKPLLVRGPRPRPYRGHKRRRRG